MASDIVAWILVAIGCIGIGWLGIWQFKKFSELDNRVARADESLLDDAGLKSHEAIQAPLGSVVLPYALAVDVPIVSQVPTVTHIDSDEVTIGGGYDSAQNS